MRQEGCPRSAVSGTGAVSSFEQSPISSACRCPVRHLTADIFFSTLSMRFVAPRVPPTRVVSYLDVVRLRRCVLLKKHSFGAMLDTDAA